MNRNRGQSRVPSFAVLLLVNELIRSATTYGIPTITLMTIIGQMLIFMGIIPIHLGNVWDVCISYNAIVGRKQYLRLVLSQLSHGDDWHLYYNMVSFLWKGRSLETRLGSIRFAITLIVFTFSTAFTYIFVNKLISDTTEDISYLNHCSVGFSGVIFALKVLTTHYDRSHVSYFMGLPIGSKYAVWAELVLIQMISPNASFVGHLAGILVGLAYIYGPLYHIIEIPTKILTETETQSNNRGNGYSNHSYNRSSNSGHYYERYVPNNMSEEEQLRRAYEQSINDSNGYNPYPRPTAQPTAPPYPTEDTPGYPTRAYNSQSEVETLRRQRLKRFQNF